MEILVTWIILTILIAVWASSWRRSVVGYLFLSLLLSPIIGAIVLLIAGKKPEADQALDAQPTIFKKCPRCAERLQPEAKICRFCRYEFPLPPQL